MPWILSKYSYKNDNGQTLRFKYCDVVSTDFRRDGFVYDFCFGFQALVEQADGTKVGALNFWLCFSKKYFPTVRDCLNYLDMYNAAYEFIRKGMNADMADPPNLGMYFGEVTEGCTLAGRMP